MPPLHANSITVARRILAKADTCRVLRVLTAGTLACLRCRAADFAPCAVCVDTAEHSIWYIRWDGERAGSTIEGKTRTLLYQSKPTAPLDRHVVTVFRCASGTTMNRDKSHSDALVKVVFFGKWTSTSTQQPRERRDGKTDARSISSDGGGMDNLR